MIYISGLILSNLKRFQEAMDIFEFAIKLDPEYLDTYNSKGKLILYSISNMFHNHGTI